MPRFSHLPDPRGFRYFALGFLVQMLAIPVVAQNGVLHPEVEGMTEIKSLDVAAEGKVIHALLGGRFAQRRGDSIAYTYSTDGGWTWSTPSFLNPEGSEISSRRGDDARLAVHERRLIAVWRGKGELPGSGEITVALSENRGKSWTQGTNPAIGDVTHNQSQLAIAADQTGTIHLTWLDDREEKGDTQGLRHASSRDGGRSWRREETLDSAICTCCWTKLLALPDRSLALLYRDDAPRDMRLARWVPRWQSWGPVSTVGRFDWRFAGCPHCGGGLTTTRTAGRQELHSIVWTGREDRAGLYYLRSADGGKAWTEPLRIRGGEARESDIAAQASGAVAVVFMEGRSRPVMWKVSRDAGRHWSDAVPLSGGEASADHPRIIATASGFRVFWTEARPSGGKTWAMAAPGV